MLYINIMSSTSSKYDNCNTKQDFVQCYERPTENMFQTYKYQHNDPKRNQFGLIGGNEVSIYQDESGDIGLIGLESDILGLNKYKNNTGENLVDGNICKDDISFRMNPEDVDQQLKHLDNSQMIDYKYYEFQSELVNMNDGSGLNTYGAGISEAFGLLR